MPKHAHMSLNDRVIIQSGLENGASRSSIAKTLGKDRSTISKEIKKRRSIVKPRATFVNGRALFLTVSICLIVAVRTFAGSLVRNMK